MGVVGLPSRYLAPLLGPLLTFASRASLTRLPRHASFDRRKTNREKEIAMKTESMSSLVALVSLLCLSLSLPVPVPAQGEVASHDQQVPEWLAGLVSPEQYDDVVKKLRLLQRRNPDGPLDDAMIATIAASPCSGSLVYLVDQYYTVEIVPKALGAVLEGMQDLPPGYSASLPSYRVVNPWRLATSSDQLLRLMVADFANWCVFLPEIEGTEDNGLEHIQRFAWFFYQNDAGRDFVQGRNPLDPSQPLPTGWEFTETFNRERGRFMDSPASRRMIPQWIADPRIEIEDYNRTKPEQYDSWNDFFAREIIVDPKTETIPSRPVTMPERDYIVVAPTDCIMNPLVQVLENQSAVTRQYVDNPLQYDTVLDVKGIPISLADLLAGVPEQYRHTFVGGTGLSCVLMPNTYHHFHSPVDGKIVYADIVPDNTYGYADWPNWVPLDGNVGRPGTDFSQFQRFQRGVIVIEVTYANLPGKQPEKLTGYVASIPVGLDTIGSVVLDDDVVPGAKVKRGYTRLGNFLYGGSLDILLFSKGLAGGAVQTRLGDQITLLRAGEEPAMKQRACTYTK
jgi:phosphatidylserine decarboxylase